MKWLPPIVVNGTSHVLPLCDATAAALLGVFSDSRPADPKRLAKRLFAQDPSLSIWTIWQASIADRIEIRTFTGAAKWLVLNKQSVLDAVSHADKTKHKKLLLPASIRNAECVAGLRKIIRRRNLSPKQFREAGFIAFVSRPQDWIQAENRPVDSALLHHHLPMHFSAWLRRLHGGKRSKPTENIRQVQKAVRHWKRLERSEQQRISRRIRTHWQTRLPQLRRGFRQLCQSIADQAEQQASFAEKLRLAKLAALKEFAYGASHEINNPLANITSRAQTLMRDESDPERRKRLAAINSQAFRAHEMISDLMLFANPPKPQPASFCLRDAVASAAKELASFAAERSVSIHYRQSSVPLHVFGDREQIRLAIKAILQNAIEASGVEQTVSLDCRAGCNGLHSCEVEVVDHGRGLDQRAAEHLFDPYFCGREAGRGLGFGLCKAWRIAELHNGQIEFESDSDRTVFRLRLPLP